MRGSRVVRDTTRVSRSAILTELEHWLQKEYKINLQQLVSFGEERLNTVLDLYGERMYYTIPPRPSQHLAELLNGIRGVYPLLRRRLPLPWGVVREWH